MQYSGYTHCACRDCFEIAIGKPTQTLCHECQDAGCEAALDAECRAPSSDEHEGGDVLIPSSADLGSPAVYARVLAANVDRVEVEMRSIDGASSQTMDFTLCELEAVARSIDVFAQSFSSLATRARCLIG